MNLLKAENDFLNRKVDILSRELRILKDIFMSHASNAHGTRLTDYDLSVLTGSNALEAAAASHSPAAYASGPYSTYGSEPSHSPEPIPVRDQLYISSHRRHAASLSLSSGESSIHDSDDDL